MSESFAPVKVQPFDTVYGEFHNWRRLPLLIKNPRTETRRRRLFNTYLTLLMQSFLFALR